MERVTQTELLQIHLAATKQELLNRNLKDAAAALAQHQEAFLQLKRSIAEKYNFGPQDHVADDGEIKRVAPPEKAPEASAEA